MTHPPAQGWRHPWAPPEQQRGFPPARVLKPQAATPLNKNRRLVVTDDDAAFRLSMCDLLQSNGYPAPESCSGGRELLKLLLDGDFDLVLLDLCMPDINGLTVLQMLRQSHPELAVVVVSGDSMIDSAIASLRLGANDYVRKPYAPEMLLHTIENVLCRQDLEKSHREISVQLEQSEWMHRFLVDILPDLIFTLDDQHNFSFVSERTANLIGCTIEALQGRPFLSIVFEDDIERTRYTLERSGKSKCTTELRFVNPNDGLFHYFDVQFIPVNVSSPENRWHCSIYVLARDITDKKQADDHLAYLAYHDILTGLPNRALFRDRLGLATIQARRNGMKVATMFVDLDRFKLANDTFGHQKGDELLKETARRLRQGLREMDTLARIGGDEFIVLLSNLRSREDAAGVAQKLVEDMAKPFLIDGNDVFLTASIGVAIFPDDGEDIEDLMRHSDIAMYHVKANGKNGFGFFSSDMGDESSQRLMIENEVRHGLESEQFALYYQPQVNANTHDVVGLEALCRWQHPSKGLVAAGGFISIVEEIGLMPDLTLWLADIACRDLRSLWDHGFDVQRMSVNVSPCVLESEDFHPRLIEILNKYAIPHANFEIEITENIFIGDRQKVTDCLMRISREGIRIAIDDFGTQYSSLSYLRHLPVNTLKIDQSFVREIEHIDDSSPIVRAVIAIAAGLGLNVVAEGVETEIQAEFLRRLGCSEFQGYLYGRPQPVGDLERILVQKATLVIA